ncbi:CHAD domain-containing protein [Mycobacterium sp. SM1]|uniref:CYTH and CHAD domain-containing protein n=1 Tax=Mycobacterium sp. SM1 TaxID=2816243 RepID=UPI001BD03C94|nr:CHAD domain-containing protein [Mycobacterium sp. SM1]MBS4728156.1 CHAD domain-containing protein [Mycobacterium sp. SM1]
MARSSRTFSTRDRVALDALAAALQPRFAVTPGPVRVVAQTWLDTFDWRLHGAGISLEYTDDGPLTLHLPDGTQRQCPLPAGNWPMQVRDLPAGPLRDALAPVVQPRALAPVVTVRRTVRESPVRNADGKTVARLVIESGDDGVTRLLVQPLRGYDGDADQIARRLADFDGLTPVATTPYDDALAHASRQPGDYDKNPTVPLRPDTPAPVAIASVLRHFAEAIDANVEGAIADVDTEFLHDLRVGVRRTRSILKLTGDVLPGDMAARFGPEFKWLGDLTTRLRDFDVFLLKLGDLASGLTSPDPADLDPFRSFLVRRRAAERRRLVRGLRSRRFETLMQTWRSALAEVAAGTGAGQPIAALARQRLRQAFRRVANRGKRITAESPSEEVHALRKRCKELRYLLEVFRPLCAETDYRHLVKELKALQDTLGEFQDGEVQRRAVREFAAAMMQEGAAPPETVLAMGELAAQLEAHQLQARAELVGKLRPFLAEKARVKTLVRS